MIADAPQIESGKRGAALEQSDLSGLRIAWYADDRVAPVTDETRAAPR